MIKRSSVSSLADEAANLAFASCLLSPALLCCLYYALPCGSLACNFRQRNT